MGNRSGYILDAIQKDDDILVQELLQKGYNVNTKCSDGNTLLIIAVLQAGRNLIHTLVLPVPQRREQPLGMGATYPYSWGPTEREQPLAHNFQTQ